MSSADPATGSPAASAGTALVPAQQCYFALLDASARRLPQRAQDYSAERQFPVPIEGMQCGRFPLADGRLAVVGIEPEQLQAVLAQRNGPVWSARPDGLPPVLAAIGGDLGSCNFLHGDFEPAPRRRLRRFAMLLLVLVVLGVAGAGAWGGWQRWQLLRAVTLTLQQERQAALAAVADATRTMPAELQVVEELRRLRSLDAGASAQVGDCLPVVEALWAVWPAMRVQVETLTVDERRCVVRGRVPSLDDADRLTEAVRGISVPGEDWVLQAPEVRRAAREGDGVQVVLVIERQDEEGRP